VYCYIEGNLFESPAQTLVNTVNTAGAMGKGIAGNFKKLLPDMFKQYQQKCEKGLITIGNLWLYRTQNKWILNFPTKTHWKYPSKVEYIEKGLKAFVNNYRKANIKSIAFPMLGCGNGELDWETVKPIMEKYLNKLPIDIFVYIKNDSIIPEHKNIEEMRKWLLSEPNYYAFLDFKNDLIELLDKQNHFSDLKGRTFGITYKENGLYILCDAKEEYVPWVGDDISKGLLELWDLIRERGICTILDFGEIGINTSMCIIGLLIKLPYIKLVTVKGNHVDVGIQLIPIKSQLPLFGNQISYRQPELI
jgi:O-acetyl-ADP-ribose deacetylase (regulator of RNase III)